MKLKKDVGEEDKQIAVISPAKFPGRTGDATHYWEIVTQLISDGFRVSLICPITDDSSELVVPSSLEIIRIPYQPPRLHQISGGFRTRHYLQVLAFLLFESYVVFRVLRNKDIKHVIIRHGVLTMQLPLLFKLMKIRAIADGELIVDLFRGKINGFLLALIKKYEQVSLGIYLRYKAASEAQAKKLQDYGIPKDKILLVPVTINVNKIPRYSVEETPEHTFGYFGVIEKRQGVDILLHAFELLMKKIPNATLFILGEGSLKNELQNKVIQKGLSDHVIFNTVTRETLLSEYFKKFRIAIIPRPRQSDSTDYILPIKLIESLAAGKPTIVFDIPVMKEIPENAIFVVHQSDPGSLADAMNILSKDSNKMKSLSREASEASKKYDAGIAIKKLLASLMAS